MIDRTRPWLTFDCYDTLVRYTENKSIVLSELIAAKGGDKIDILTGLKAFETSERNLQKTPFIILNEILRRSLHISLSSINLEVTQSDEEKIIDAVKIAPPFPDVRPALEILKKTHRLAILSNSEPAIIKHNISTIGVQFDAVVLAAEAKCYKPDPGMFYALLDRIDELPSGIVHIAQSFYHDMRTAKDLGFGCRIWINRYDRKGDHAYKPEFELTDLSGVRSVLK